MSDDGPSSETAVVQRLLDGLRLGHDVDLRADDGGLTEVDATAFRAALLLAGWEADPRPITISGAAIRGQLDLRNTVIDVPLVFEGCTFDRPIRLEGATLPALAFVDCPMIPGILANGCTIGHDLVIDRSTVSGAHPSLASMRQTAAIWLCEARLGGRLLVRNQTVVDGEGGRAIQADRVQVGANVRILGGSEVRGELRLLSAQVAGSLDIVSSTVTAHQLVAVELAEARFGGSLFLARTTSDGQPTLIDGLLVMSDVRVGAFVSIRGSVLRGRSFTADGPYDRPRQGMGHTAILAPRCEIGDDVYIDERTTVDGGLYLSHAEVLGDVLFNGLVIDNPGDRSLDLGSAHIGGSLVARGAELRGTVWLAGCRISASLALEDSAFAQPDGPAAIQAAGLSVAGDIQLNRVTTIGGALRFRAIEIGGEVSAEDAVLDNPTGDTLSFSSAQIKGAIKLGGLVSTGLLTINRASVGGRLQLTDATLVCRERWSKNVNGNAVEIISSEITGGLYLDWAEVHPSIDLFSSTTTIVADQVGTWPERSDLSGLLYERFDAPDPAGGDPWNVEDRLAILRSQDPFDLAPYEVAARVYADHGRFADADRLRIVGRQRAATDAHRTARAGRSVLGRAGAAVRLVGDWFYRQSVGYGFKPGRALALIAVLVVVVGLSLAGPWSARDQVMRATGASNVVYSPAGPLGGPTGQDGLVVDPRCGGDVRCFQPGIYAIETVVPLIELGQRQTWRVDGTARFGPLYDIWLTFATIAGWTLSTVFVLSFSRLGRTS